MSGVVERPLEQFVVADRAARGLGLAVGFGALLNASEIVQRMGEYSAVAGGPARLRCAPQSRRRLEACVCLVRSARRIEECSRPRFGLEADGGVDSLESVDDVVCERDAAVVVAGLEDGSRAVER